MKPADVVFVIDEKSHPRFKREGNDLMYTHRVPLVEALCGPTFHVQTLDGRSLPVTVHSTVGPNAVKVPLPPSEPLYGMAGLVDYVNPMFDWKGIEEHALVATPILS